MSKRRNVEKRRAWLPRPYRAIEELLCSAWEHDEGNERCERPATRVFRRYKKDPNPVTFCDLHGSECGELLLRPIKEAVKPERKGISPRRRFAILQRDAFRCQLCGRTAEHDLVALEVDHMQPVSKGGLDDDENLWTLCRDCNQGKSDAL